MERPTTLSRGQSEILDMPEGKLELSLRFDVPLGELSPRTLLTDVTPSGVKVTVELDAELGIHFIRAYPGGYRGDVAVDASLLRDALFVGFVGCWSPSELEITVFEWED